MNVLRARLLQRWLLAAVLLCMGLAQAIQLAHRTLHHDVRMLAHKYEEQLAHSPHHQDQRAHSDTQQSADCDHGQNHNHGWLSHLFASHQEGDESCRLMDGASGFDMLFSPVAGILIAPNALLFIAMWQTERAAWAALLREPRGPPAFSL